MLISYYAVLTQRRYEALDDARRFILMSFTMEIALYRN